MDQDAEIREEAGGQLILGFPSLDSPLTGKVKGDRHTMVFNFFSLRREKVTKLPTYDDGRTWIEVSGTHHGVANIWDKEIIVYAASLLAEKMNKGEPPTAKVVFNIHDLLAKTGNSAGGSAYERVEESLARLKSTFIKTNIETGGEGEDRGFSWLDEYRISYRRNREGKKVMRSVEITLCSWLFRAIVQDRHLLTYHPGYFDLPPVLKRLYEIARSGPQGGFKISLPKLLARVGTNQTPRRFKSEIAAICEAQAPDPAKRNPKRILPEYDIALVDPRIRRAIDPQQPKGISAGAPTKSWMVAFFPREGGPRAARRETPLPDLDEDTALVGVAGAVPAIVIDATPRPKPKARPPTTSRRSSARPGGG